MPLTPSLIGPVVAVLLAGPPVPGAPVPGSPAATGAPVGTTGRPAAAAPAPAAASPAPAEEAAIPGGGETVPVAEAPLAWAPAIRRAEEAARAFQQALQARLAAALSQGGPPAAVDVCATEAASIASTQASAAGVRRGRTSDRLRNAANAPPSWARVPTALAAGEKASAVQPLAVDLGPRLGVLFPIGVRPACLGCHGPADGIAPKVKEALARRYPADRAVGYADGDFRGFVWVEVPR